MDTAQRSEWDIHLSKDCRGLRIKAVRFCNGSSPKKKHWGLRMFQKPGDLFDNSFLCTHTHPLLIRFQAGKVFQFQVPGRSQEHPYQASPETRTWWSDGFHVKLWVHISCQQLLRENVWTCALMSFSAMMSFFHSLRSWCHKDNPFLISLLSASSHIGSS